MQAAGTRLIIRAKGEEKWPNRGALLGALGLVMLLPTASCVPASAGAAPRIAAAPAPSAIAEAVRPGTSVAAAIESFVAPPAAPEAAGVPAAIPAFVAGGGAPALNAAIPFTPGPNPAASAFFLRARGQSDQQRSLQCLTEALYYEATSESDDGQRAVAQVILNRMRHPAYPASVCGVIYQGAQRWMACQFSYACDGARGRLPSASGWARSRAIAAQALAGRVYAPVGLATHYHTWNVVPSWAHRLEKSAVVGAHIFYRLNGALGRSGAFHQRYAGVEPFPVAPAVRPATALAGAPVLDVKFAGLSPVAAAGAAASSQNLSDASPAAELLTVPKPKPSPIMEAVTASTVREEYRNSGAIRAEFAGK